MTPSDRDCFTDFALQEHAQGRLDPAVRQEVAAHAQTCSECGAALHAFEAESTLLRAVLASDLSGAPGLTDETLALYTGGALPPAEAARVEAILSRHPATLQRLLALTRETAAARETEADEQASSRALPAGEILRMPKRIASPVTVTAPRKASGGQSS